MNKKYVLRIPMNKKEQTDFNKSFKKSGFMNMAEFVRFLIREFTGKTQEK